MLARTDGFLDSPFAIGAWVARRDGVVIGHVSLHTRASSAVVELATQRLGVDAFDIGAVARLLVDPHVRRTGVARSLLDVAVAEAQRRGLVAILDVVDRFEPAIRLHERAGWRRLGTGTVGLPDGSSVDEHLDAAPDASSGQV